MMSWVEGRRCGPDEARAEMPRRELPRHDQLRKPFDGAEVTHISLAVSKPSPKRIPIGYICQESGSCEKGSEAKTHAGGAPSMAD